MSAPTSLPSNPDGPVCTQEQQGLSGSKNAPLHCLTRGQSIGLTVRTVAAFVSMLAVCYVFARILLNVIRAARRSPGRWRLVKVPMDVYMISLFCANFLHAISPILNVKWLHEGIVYTGHYCIAQGFIEQVGAMTLALTTLLIAVHTFVVVWWSRGLTSLSVPRFAVCFVWLMTFVFVVAFAASHRHSTPAYYAPVPYWCWVNEPYLWFGIAGEYIWFWLALLVCLLMYIPLFLWSLGYITIDSSEPWWIFHLHTQRQQVEGARRRALTMITYPIAFSVLILPLSIVRFIHFGQVSHGVSNVPSSATLGVATVYDLSGLVEVIIFFQTRQGLLLFGENDDGERGTELVLKIESAPVIGLDDDEDAARLSVQ